MKKKILLLLLFFISFIIPNKVFAESKISLVNNIKPVINKTNLKITYQIIGVVENEEGVSAEPTELEVDFSDCNVNNYQLSKTTDLDFSNVNYTKPGTYRYVIRQQKLSDTKSFKKSKQIYFVYVDVTMNTDGTKNIEVSDLVYDTDKQEKTNLVFDNEPVFTHFEIENRVDGALKEQDKDVYFKYKIQINGEIGNQFQILGQDDMIYYNGNSIQTIKTYTIKENNNYEYIYLKDKQIITIGQGLISNTEEDTNTYFTPTDSSTNNSLESGVQGRDISLDTNSNQKTIEQIPLDTEITVEKVAGEKWLTTMNGKETNTISMTAQNDNNYLLIINKRDFDSAITGVFSYIYPFIIMTTILLCWLVIWHRNKLKNN